jgi:DNA-binding NarL/FixJ family response regulator
MAISVLIVDDHAVVVETLALALGRADDLEVAATAGTGEEGLARASALQPAVALVDIGLPDIGGIEVLRRLRATSPGTRVVILTGSSDPAFFAQAMEAGVSGYLTKDAGLGEVTDAIRAAHEGRVVVPEKVVGRLLGFRSAPSGLGADLTHRELQVLALLGEGCDAKRIARTLNVSWHTARSYIKNVLVKLDAHSQLEAVMTAMRLGILESRTSTSK